MKKYRCACGYVYDPEHGIRPGTAFENLPDDWRCPTCGADKTRFKMVDE